MSCSQQSSGLAILPHMPCIFCTSCGQCASTHPPSRRRTHLQRWRAGRRCAAAASVAASPPRHPPSPDAAAASCFPLPPHPCWCCAAASASAALAAGPAPLPAWQRDRAPFASYSHCRPAAKRHTIKLSICSMQQPCIAARFAGRAPLLHLHFVGRLRKGR